MMIPLSNTHGLLKVQGPDAKKFLQGQLTCNLDLLPHHAQTLAAHCNPQGRVISFFRLYHAEEAYYLCMQKSMLPIAFGQLKKYALFYKSTLSLDDAVPIYGSLTQRDINLFHHPQQVNPEALIAWQLAEINANIPTLYPETSALFLPHELNLPALNAVSFDKGCYTGQEIIARMHYRAKLKKSLHRVQIESHSMLSRGADIYYHQNERISIAGTLVDFCPMEDQKYVGLVVAEAAKLTNKPLFLADNKEISLTVE